MATTTKTDAFIPNFDAATGRVRATNERILNAGRTFTGAYLDSVETYAASITRAERKLGAQAQFEAVGTLLNAHADLTDDVVKASVSAARELVAA
jgi:hypothetical protein